ncbi:MAG: hypothetical protein M9931_05640 [Chitinophagales bacterium]|nr:hypothetical protein [Chitinophagales bacterium]HRN93766.1 hypothetical protein [Chitinophagales bacterium]HRP40078.1 hypothetical protein [Chitinophagales bacterium]
MYRIKSIFIITCMVFMLFSCKEKAERAKVYHDAIVKATAIVTDSVIDYADVIHSGNRTNSLVVTENYLSLILRTMDSVNAKNNFEGDSALRVSSLGLLGFYKDYIRQNFIPYFSTLSADSLNENELLIADSLHRKMMDDEVQYWNNFNNAEKDFSNTYDLMSLEE